ncbi:hypothetical protein V5O48_005260 [Marasmius crinis-equi]|uniref:Uncharacterized protein n=1 Tax=Marasmius crinis-equi TaxID=585013 RepID=A0ABR3FMU1_9AGAR
MRISAPSWWRLILAALVFPLSQPEVHTLKLLSFPENHAGVRLSLKQQGDCPLPLECYEESSRLGLSSDPGELKHPQIGEIAGVSMTALCSGVEACLGTLSPRGDDICGDDSVLCGAYSKQNGILSFQNTQNTTLLYATGPLTGGDLCTPGYGIISSTMVPFSQVAHATIYERLICAEASFWVYTSEQQLFILSSIH